MTIIEKIFVDREFKRKFGDRKMWWITKKIARWMLLIQVRDWQSEREDYFSGK